VVPRVLGVAVSTFCLTIVFILVTFASGYWFAAWMGKGSGDFFLFVRADSSAVVKRKFGVMGDACFEITRGHGQPLPEKNASIICNGAPGQTDCSRGRHGH
jgi:hypothetical protein